MSETIHLYVQNAVRTEKVPYFELPADIHVHGQILLTKPRMQGIIGEVKVRLLHSALGMSTEIVELQQAIEKKDRVGVLEELGDVLWYWAVGLDALNLRDFSDPDEEPLSLTWAEAERRLIAHICLWADLVRRHAIHAKDLNPDSALVALRDIWRGVGEVCRSLGISREAVMERNIAKLRARFPAQYDGVRFEVRDLVVERHVLEAQDEVEAARTEVATMRAWAEEAARAENENADDARCERAAVVAFLTGENDARCRFISDHVAMRIERGEHRREEGA